MFRALFRSSLPLLGYLWSISCLELDSPCYFPNGTDSANFLAGDGIYKPCNPGDSVSMCCRAGDKCRQDGLCGDSPFDGMTWRGMCTDPTWESSECLKLCINGTSTITVSP